MAQADTGLGWSAKEEWLTQAGNLTIATDRTAGGPSYIGQPVPYATSAAEAVALGEYWAYDSLYFNNPRYEHYVFSKTEGAEIFVANVNNLLFCMSTTERATVALAQKDKISGTITEYSQTTLNQQDTTTGLWFSNLQTRGNITQEHCNPNLLWASTEREALDALEISESVFTKTNSGYAVTCVARWKTPNGTILESPILISTESDNVEMSTTATGIYFAKLNALYNGRKFYMGFYDRPYTGTLTTTFPVLDRSYSDAPTFTLEELFKYIAKDVYANIIVTNSPDPYQEETGESGEAGGDGEDDEADEIPFTDAPVSGIAYSGFLTIFTPNLSQLQSLSNYMWSDFFDVDTWKKLFANPMDAILGLHIIPCSPGYSGNKEVKVGGKGTGVSMDYTTIRYHKVSMGTCEVPKKWGSYLDYNPYTKVSIFLPYIGFRDLDTDDVMDRTLALQYIVDILTGACVAELRCGTDVLYSWEGNCANPVPITSNSWSSAIGSAVSIAAAIATTALTHGASAPMIAGTVASVGANSMNLKPSVSRSGSLGGSGGFIAKQTPYIIRTVPNLVIPADQNKFIGYPSFVTTSLGSLTGYNEISSIHLEGIPATGNELTEIETLLKGGVIF